MTRRPPARLVALVAALVALTASCGREASRPIGIKEYPGDIVFGDQALPPPPPVPPSAEPTPTFPGFIVPPAPRETFDLEPVTTTPSSAPSTTTTAVPVACPDLDPFAVPAVEEQGVVTQPPAPQTLTYRLAGGVTVDGKTTPLPASEQRTVGVPGAAEVALFRFNVGVKQGAAETVTTYQVDQRSGNNDADGISIVQIRTSDQVATDAFTPSAPIKVMPLPPVKGKNFTGAGADPLHGTAITIYGELVDKVRVNACGVAVEGWQVKVGSDPTTGQPSSIQAPGRNLTMSGTYVVSTQFGGLIVADDLVLDGTEDGRRVTKKQASTTNTEPRRLGK